LLHFVHVSDNQSLFIATTVPIPTALQPVNVLNPVASVYHLQKLGHLFVTNFKSGASSFT